MISRRAFLAATSSASILLTTEGKPTTPVADVDSSVTAIARRAGIIGAAVGIRSAARDDGAVTGVAAIPFNAAVTRDTLFHVGSNGKLMTAVAILRLVDAGRLTLTTRIGEILEGLPIDWRERDVESLLTHTSGLPDYADRLVWDREFDRAGFLKLTADRPTLFDQGASWAYSDTGYVLLGWIIEAVSGRRYRDVIQQDIFGPLALPHARLDDAGKPILGRAEPYDATESEPRYAVRMASGISAEADGGVLMSARDVPSWDHALTSGTMLSAQSRNRLLAPTRLTTGRTAPYGLGMFTGTLRGQPYQFHGGSVPGFLSFYLRCPEERVSVLVMTNTDLPSSAAVRHLAHRVAEILAPGSTVLSLPAIPDAHPALTRTMQKLMGRGDARPDPDLLAPEKRVLLGKPGGHGALRTFATGLDPNRIELIEDLPGKGELFRRYRVPNGEFAEHLIVGYAPDGRIFWTFFE
jgi:D-alanyl-D-alanine carboxypeptidase